MRISDWSSDVCSSDLARARIIAESLEPGANVSAVPRRHGLFPQQLYTWRRGFRERAEAMSFAPAMVERPNAGALPGPPPQSVGRHIVPEPALGRAPCRESACQYVTPPVVPVALPKNTPSHHQS